MCYELKSAVRVLREKGISAFAKKLLIYLMQFFSLPVFLFKIRRVRQNLKLDEAISFAFKGCFGLIRPFQVQEEIQKLLKILNKTKPKVVLEIGTANGGTLFLFSRVASKKALILSIDLPGGCFGGGSPWWKRMMFGFFVLPKQKIHLLRADSHKKETLDKIKSILGGQKIDFLFIDGDHSYKGVKKDFEMYSGLVKKGGMIAFHDIVPHPPETGCEVSRFWREIKNRYSHLEIIKDLRQKWAGIGLIRID